MIKFVLDYSNGVPIYRQIIDQILFGIASGQLNLGSNWAVGVEAKYQIVDGGQFVPMASAMYRF